MKEKLCPQCSAVWTMEEIDWQECFACGYPDANIFDDENDENDDYFEA